MKLLHLYLRHFRNIEEASVDFSSGVNHIVGPNAQGKSNLLEAIFFLVTGRSFRTVRLQEMIQKGHEAFFLEAFFERDGVEQSLRIRYDGQNKKITHNQTPFRSFNQLLGLLQGVMFAPQDSDLIRGAPSLRRRYLDLQLAQAHPLYLHHLARYHRGMKQRKQILRMGNLTGIGAWEAEMAHSAAFLAKFRQETVEGLSQKAERIHEFLSGGQESLKIRYRCFSKSPEDPLQSREAFAATLERNRQRDRELGQSTVGPHRDDLLLHLSGLEARHFGSEGQQRCAVASLRLAEWEQLREQSEIEPLFCVDDLGISLDGKRRELVSEHIGNLSTQVFLTSPQMEAQACSNKESILSVQAGSISPLSQPLACLEALFPAPGDHNQRSFEDPDHSSCLD